MKSTIIILILSMAFSRALAQKEIVGDPPQDEIIYFCGPCGCANDGKYFAESGACAACPMPLQPIILGLDLDLPSVETPTVGMFLFNGADVMDVSGPISVFEHSMFNIITFSKTADPVRIGMNLELKPDYTLASLPPVDIIVLPGGGMAESNPGDEEVVKFIQNRKDSTEVLFSVCSGAFFLGEAGLLDGQRATTFASLIPQLSSQYPKAITLNDVKYADNGQIVTSAGLSSGIDAAFHVVSKFYGIGRAQDIANHMEYPWKRENDYARSQLADGFGAEIRPLISLFSTSYFYSQGDNNTWEYRYQLTQKIKPKEIIKLIQMELDKKSNWKTLHSNRLSISGHLDHQVLDRGKIDIMIDDDQYIAVIKSERLERYTP